MMTNQIYQKFCLPIHGEQAEYTPKGSNPFYNPCGLYDFTIKYDTIYLGIDKTISPNSKGAIHAISTCSTR